MKIISQKIVLLLLIGVLSISATMAQKTYDLWIAGELVTYFNASDLSTIDGVTGTISYDNTTKTLTLNNAEIDASGKYYAIKSDIENLKINLIGTNQIKSDWSALIISKNTEIKGNGLLKTSNAYAGIVLDKCPLTIKDCTIEAKGTYNGICGSGDIYQEENLTIENATIKAIGGPNDCSIGYLNNLILNNALITTPPGAAFNSNLNGVALNGNLVKELVVIYPIVEEYNLWINGLQVTSSNAGYLNEISGVDGTVTYDNENKTLTLDNATLDMPVTNFSVIKNEIPRLKIKLIGSNNLSAVNKPCLLLKAETQIEGSGSITASSQANIIYMDKAPLTINDCYIEATGVSGISGYDGQSDEDLTINNATVKATGTNSAIRKIKSLTLEGCAITSPKGAAFNEDLNGVALNSSLVTGQVTIEPVDEYPLYINGITVNSANASDLSIIEGVEGTVTYNHETKTLTLNNANIYNTNEVAINNYEIDNFKIKLIGTNTIIAETGMLIQMTSEIIGPGSINITINNAQEHGIQMLIFGFLSIKNCQIKINAYNGGIVGQSINFLRNLTIDNASIEVTGSGLASIAYIKNFTLNNCAITAPEGAAFDVQLHGVAIDGVLVKEKIVIEPIISVTDISVTPTATTMLVNGTQQLTAIVQPDNATNQKITWVSNNTNIATVNSTGLVTGVSKGTATIIATTEDGGHAATCTVTVETENVAVTGVSINPTTTTVNVGNTQQITATIQPTNATNQNVSWTSSDNSVATVGANGLVTGVAVSTTCTVTVTENIGVTPVVATNSLKIYPNPVKEILNIETEAKQFTVEIYNVLGKLVTKKVNTKQISVVDLPAGIYMLKFKTEKGVITKKIIK